MTDTQQDLALDTFDQDLVHGRVKSAMSGVKSRDLWQVAPDRLKFMPSFNRRVPRPGLTAHIRKLANSMKEEGYYMDKPIAVFVAQEGDVEVLYVTDGHCRTEAVQLAIQEGAEILTVPVVLEERGVSIEDLTVKLFQSNTGLNLTPYETGLVCKRLVRNGWEPESVATRLDLGVGYVEGLLTLVGGPKFIRDTVIAEKISATEAVKLLKKHGNKAVAVLEKMLERAQQEGKGRVTAIHAPGAGIKKAVKKHSETLYQAAKTIRQDPGFVSLSVKTRMLLDEVLKELDKAEKDLASQPAPAAQNQNDQAELVA